MARKGMQMAERKKVLGVSGTPRQHWVGDGFPVRSLFNYNGHGRMVSPFLLLDYAGPMEFAPAEKPRGVGEHPHRGFETVTIVYEGEVAHRDSTGQGGVIGPGDVQWMTAAAGILHEEFHSEVFTRTGGTLLMVQLWVNLPAKDKMSAPGYQAIQAADIPLVELDGGGGTARVIAGLCGGQKGPARTFTPMNVWDLRLRAGAEIELAGREGWNAMVVVLGGGVRVNGSAEAREAQVAMLAPGGDALFLETREETAALLLSGAAIDEPVVGYGPFVMNTRAEIEQAFADYRSGQFGQIGS